MSQRNEFDVKYVKELMDKTYERIVQEFEANFPRGTFGGKQIEYGKMYLKVFQDAILCRIAIEKDEFNKAMNERLAADTRFYVREPLTLPNDDRFLDIWAPWVYFNYDAPLNIVSVYYYLEEYVYKLKENKHHPYDLLFAKGKIMDGQLFALVHFAKYNEDEIKAMIERLKRAGSRRGIIVELVSEPEIFVRSDRDDRYYIMIRDTPANE